MGALVIDLGKRFNPDTDSFMQSDEWRAHRNAKRPTLDSALDYIAWNRLNPGQPKDSRGRWTDSKMDRQAQAAGLFKVDEGIYVRPWETSEDPWFVNEYGHSIGAIRTQQEDSAYRARVEAAAAEEEAEKRAGLLEALRGPRGTNAAFAALYRRPAETNAGWGMGFDHAEYIGRGNLAVRGKGVIIDLGKRHGSVRGAASKLTAEAWNKANPAHPRSVRNGQFVSIMGSIDSEERRKSIQEMGDFLEGMVKEHGGGRSSLGKALLEAIGRDRPGTGPRKLKTLEERNARLPYEERLQDWNQGRLLIEAQYDVKRDSPADLAERQRKLDAHAARKPMPNPAKPLRASKPGTVHVAAATALLDSIKAKPRVSAQDKAQLDEVLGKLTKPQIMDLARSRGWEDSVSASATKPKMIEAVSKLGVGGRLTTQSVMDGDSKNDARRQALAVQGRTEAEGSVWENKPDMGEPRKPMPNPAKPLRAKSKSGADVASAIDRIKEIAQNPQNGDRERVEEMLADFKMSELREVANSGVMGPVLPARNKKDLIDGIGSAASFGSIFSDESALNNPGAKDKLWDKRPIDGPGASEPRKPSGARDAYGTTGPSSARGKVHRAGFLSSGEKLDNAEAMFGSDRSKWTPAQRAQAEKLTAKEQLRRTGRVAPGARPVESQPIKPEMRFPDNNPGSMGTLADRQEDRVREMIASPKEEHRAELKALLSGMTIKEMEAFVKRVGGESAWPAATVARTKADKVSQSVEGLIGYKLNSSAIRDGSWKDGNFVPPEAGTYQRPKEPAFTVPTVTMSTNPRKKQTWGGAMEPGDAHYHGDGAIGRAVSDLGGDTQLEVGGDSLANRLDDIATRTTTGKITPQQQVAELKALHAQIPEGRGKRRVAEAIGELDVTPKGVPERVHVGEGAPNSMRNLVEGLASIPLMSSDEPQAARLWDTVARGLAEIEERQKAGRNIKLLAGQLQQSLLGSVPHESMEGSAMIRAMVNNAIEGLKVGV